MHIAINGWFVGQPLTGSGQYIHRLLENLPKYGPAHRYSLLLPGDRSADLCVWTDQWPGVTVLSVPVPPLPERLSKLWWEQVAVPRASRQIEADVLWVPYWAAPLWQPAPVVVTVHDVIPLLLPEYRGNLLNRLYTGLVSHTARRSAAIITVSQASARDIVLHLRVPGERVFAVHHGPNLELGQSSDKAMLAALRERYGLPERFFLYLGGFDVRKNLTSVLQAYRQFLVKGGDPAVELVIAGKLPGRSSRFFPDPQAVARDLGIREAVHFIGWVAEEDKPALYSMATALVFPSLYEGFGMMVLEAMGAGCPVITSAAR